MDTGLFQIGLLVDSFICLDSAFSQVYIYQSDSTMVGIAEIRENIVSYFPNPAQNEFTIHVVNLNEQYTIEVSNFLGESVYITSINDSKSSKVNTLNWPIGVYFIHIKNNKGSLLGNEKLVISR